MRAVEVSKVLEGGKRERDGWEWQVCIGNL